MSANAAILGPLDNNLRIDPRTSPPFDFTHDLSHYEHERLLDEASDIWTWSQRFNFEGADEAIDGLHDRASRLHDGGHLTQDEAKRFHDHLDIDEIRDLVDMVDNNDVFNDIIQQIVEDNPNELDEVLEQEQDVFTRLMRQGGWGDVGLLPPHSSSATSDSTEEHGQRKRGLLSAAGHRDISAAVANASIERHLSLGTANVPSATPSGMPSSAPSCPSDDWVDCVEGNVRGTPSISCATACAGECCVSTDACRYTTACIKKDGSCNGIYACYLTNDESSYNLQILGPSCVGRFACHGMFYKATNTGTVSLTNSCLCDYSCFISYPYGEFHCGPFAGISAITPLAGLPTCGASFYDVIGRTGYNDCVSFSPSSMPSTTSMPSSIPSEMPSKVPSDAPSLSPSLLPSIDPSSLPSLSPSETPSSLPSSMPSDAPSVSPSLLPSIDPSSLPSSLPSLSPSETPSSLPSSSPTASKSPSALPSEVPSNVPSLLPSSNPTISQSPSPPPTPRPRPRPVNPPSSRPPTAHPSSRPSLQPSAGPFLSSPPSHGPSLDPTNIKNPPSSKPSPAPSVSQSPSPMPSPEPSTYPSSGPSSTPSSTPSLQPSVLPSSSPTPECQDFENFDQTKFSFRDFGLNLVAIVFQGTLSSGEFEGATCDALKDQQDALEVDIVSCCVSAEFIPGGRRLQNGNTTAASNTTAVVEFTTAIAHTVNTAVTDDVWQVAFADAINSDIFGDMIGGTVEYLQQLDTKSSKSGTSGGSTKSSKSGTSGGSGGSMKSSKSMRSGSSF